MPVETLAAAPQYQAAKPNRVEIPGAGQGEHIILSRPDLGGAFKPSTARDLFGKSIVIANSAELAQPKIPLAQAGLESKKPSILNLRSDPLNLVEQAAKVGYNAKEKLSRFVLTIKDIFAKGSERFNRIRPRRPRRPRCLHGKLKTEPCDRCTAEARSKNKS